MKFWNEICRNESLHTLIKVRFSFSGLSTFWGIRHTQLSAVIENPLFHITLQGATLASGRPLLAHKASGKSYSFPPDSLAELSRGRKDHSWEMFLYFCCYCFKYQFITCILTTIKIRIFWQKNFSSKVFGQLSLKFSFWHKMQQDMEDTKTKHKSYNIIFFCTWFITNHIFCI